MGECISISPIAERVKLDSLTTGGCVVGGTVVVGGTAVVGRSVGSGRVVTDVLGSEGSAGELEVPRETARMIKPIRTRTSRTVNAGKELRFFLLRRGGGYIGYLLSVGYLSKR